ncbi:cuticle protein 18.6 [Scaptodrosophila lebanonensis]|uniref:Cuticle protein 18.6 n=1 Tax=Drosophila lebanonensis TaxID=7225 RepID=A0A6J2TIJ5_DROLE|nr:cuticle protein 18.6 [Scaptodrosophila lebanonensis]
MAFKLVALVCFVAAASAGIIPLEHHQLEHQQQAQLYQAASPQQQVLYHKAHAPAHEIYPDDPHPKYNFAYDVKDAISGDSKSQTESRDGDVVQGEYSLDDADGFRRTVKYTADSVNGFNAVVHREPLTHKVVAAAPVQYHHAAPQAVVKSPVSYAAPAYSAPTYASLPAHHENQHQQAATYATYEAPAAHESHDYYHH